MNPDIYYRLKASEKGMIFRTDEQIIKALQGNILQLQEMMITILNKEQNDLLVIHQIQEDLLKKEKRIAICEHQIESKQYQYLKKYI